MSQRKKDEIHNNIIYVLTIVSILGMACGLLGLVYGNTMEKLSGCIVFWICATWMFMFFYANSEEDKKKEVPDE